MANESPVKLVADLLKTLKGSGLQLRACSLTPEGGLSFEVLPELSEPVLDAKGNPRPEAATFDQIPIPGWDPALAKRDPQKAERQAAAAVRAALGMDLPSEMASDF